MICAVEDNPAHIFYYNYSKVRELANNIKILVNAYYGVGDVVVLNAGECETDPESVPTDLVYSELIGSWLDEYGTYNCYAYALGQKQYAEPGDFCNKTLDVSQLVVRIANLVKEDLIALGCADAATWSAAETRTACPGGNLIALRMNPGLDYHFMRLDNSDGQWYHKPDVKAVMRYIGNPLAVNPYWTNEGYIGNTYQAGEMTYCSAIYIIGYNFEHVCEFEYCGGSRHILTCVDCGVTEGAAVACMVKNNVCVACGHDFDGFQIAAMEKNAIIDERQRG